jgi:hypothetical protein
MDSDRADIHAVYSIIRRGLIAMHNPYDDFTSSYCKHELYLLKSWLEDRYQELPPVVGEDEWKQERLIKVLKR